MITINIGHLVKTMKQQDYLQLPDGTWMDQATGEVVENAQAFLITPRHKYNYAEGYYVMSNEAALALATKVKSKEAFKVLMVLNAYLDFNNWINVNQSQLAKQIGLTRNNFSRGLRELRDLGIILDGPKVGRSATLRLNSEIGWKGSAKSHKKVPLEQRMEERGMKIFQGGKSDDRCEDTPDMFPKP